MGKLFLCSVVTVFHRCKRNKTLRQLVDLSLIENKFDELSLKVQCFAEKNSMGYPNQREVVSECVKACIAIS